MKTLTSSAASPGLPNFSSTLPRTRCTSGKSFPQREPRYPSAHEIETISFVICSESEACVEVNQVKKRSFLATKPNYSRRETTKEAPY